jgi:hypothetical protein
MARYIQGTALQGNKPILNDAPAKLKCISASAGGSDADQSTGGKHDHRMSCPIGTLMRDYRRMQCGVSARSGDATLLPMALATAGPSAPRGILGSNPL